MRRASAIAANTNPGFKIAEFSLRFVPSSQENLLQRLHRAKRTIRTLEHRVAMQERTYRAAMQEKNQKIHELQLSLQTEPQSTP